MSVAGLSWGRKKQAVLEGSRVFTDHVRLLAEEKPLDEARMEPLWNALRAALRSELRRRGLWDSPPAYLGIYGWESWEEGAVEELLFECYSFIFVQIGRASCRERV